MTPWWTGTTLVVLAGAVAACGSEPADESSGGDLRGGRASGGGTAAEGATPASTGGEGNGVTTADGGTGGSTGGGGGQGGASANGGTGAGAGAGSSAIGGTDAHAGNATDTGTGGGSANTGGTAAGSTPSTGGSDEVGGTTPSSGGAPEAGASSSAGTSAGAGAIEVGGTSTTGGSAGSSEVGGTSEPGGASGTGGGSGTGGASGEGGVAGTGGSLPSHCTLPTQASEDVAYAAYQTFKTTVVTSEGAGGNLRITKPDSGTVTGSTVSEGMGYGLLLAVYHDDPTTFDALWRYVAEYLNGNGLMDWEVDPSGNVIGSGAASDGDEDIAFALLMAARRWGSRGTLDEDYQVLGARMVEAMWDHEIDTLREHLLKPGDSWGDRDLTNLSYFAPAYYRVFGEATNNVAGWNAVIDGNYTILERTLNTTLGNAENGLVPAWSNSQGGLESAFDGAPTHFQNDSTRTPFRIGQDFCWYGEPRAKAYLDKIGSFYAGVGVANIEDGYDLDGTPRPERPSIPEQAASFVGPAGVAFMSDPRYAAELDQAWALVATEELTNGTIYYQKSWTALSLLMMSGTMVVFPNP